MRRDKSRLYNQSSILMRRDKSRLYASILSHSYDICIIGAGVVGCAIARELSRYNVAVCLIDRCDDVACGSTKANSGIVHGGYDDKSGSVKAAFSAKGNALYQQLDDELHFGFKRTGSLVIGFNDEDRLHIEALYENGKKNGAVGLNIVDGDFVRQLEPHINPQVTCALYCESAGITSPYEFAIALAENAINNGVKLFLNTAVTSIVLDENIFQIHGDDKVITAKCVINAAGLFADQIAKMVGLDDFKIIPRKGEYLLLDKEQGRFAKQVIFQVPTKLGKGVLVTPTYHGNLLIGPNAEAVDDKEDHATTAESLRYIREQAKKSIPDFDDRKVITSFSGNRATSSTGDFVIEESRVKGFIHVAGIESPGLTAAPAIALHVVELVRQTGIHLKENPRFNPYREPYQRISEMNETEINALIKAFPAYGRIVCRCETVSEGEILDALNRSIPLYSTDAIKRRTRCGMGRCQAGFCMPKLLEILAKYYNEPLNKVSKKGFGSELVFKRTKKSLEEK